MNLEVFKKLFSERLISGEALSAADLAQKRPLSVHWELRTLLYLGVVLFTTGAGVLIYKNIDSIGHNVLLVAIAVICAGCIGWCIKHSKGYSHNKVESPGIGYDYLVLLGCLLLITFTGYLQFQYNVFGNHWGLAAFIPMVLLFTGAYYFDHLGVLSLAITNLAAWLGITVTPAHLFEQNDFADPAIIYTGLAAGILLIAVSFVSSGKNIKAHFSFTYKNYGAHILFISLLAGLFYYDTMYLLWFIALVAVSYLFFKSAVKENSYYFLVIAILYAYTGLSYVVVRLLSNAGGDMMPLYLGIFYFIASGIILIRVFIYYNKMLSKNAGVQQSGSV